MWLVSLYLKIVLKTICVIFVKLSIADVWQGCEDAWSPEYIRVLNMVLVLNIPGFHICQDSEYFRVLVIPKLGMLLTVFEFSWVIPGCAWLCLNMPECWTIIRPSCDWSRQGHNFSFFFKIVQKRIYIIFVKSFTADVWQNCEYVRGTE